VLNFVFGGLGAIFGLLGLMAMLAIEHGDAAANVEVPGKGLVYFAILFLCVRVALMIASGVGYLKQKKFLGRTLGNTYGVLAIADTIIGLALLHGAFSFWTIIGLVYPVLTLALLNTTFKDDFVN